MWKTYENKEPCEINSGNFTSGLHQRITPCMWKFHKACAKCFYTRELISWAIWAMHVNFFHTYEKKKKKLVTQSHNVIKPVNFNAFHVKLFFKNVKQLCYACEFFWRYEIHIWCRCQELIIRQFARGLIVSCWRQQTWICEQKSDEFISNEYNHKLNVINRIGSFNMSLISVFTEVQFFQWNDHKF